MRGKESNRAVIFPLLIVPVAGSIRWLILGQKSKKRIKSDQLHKGVTQPGSQEDTIADYKKKT
jgi:hypothetical protein